MPESRGRPHLAGYPRRLAEDFRRCRRDANTGTRDATILHCLGIDHAKFTHKFRGLNTRLTGVEEAHVVKAILA